MLIGYSMPAPSAIALSGGSAAWLTADGGAACYDGKPARKARLQWRADLGTVSLTLTHPSTSLRLFAALGLVGIPDGTVIEVWGKRAGDASPVYDFGAPGANYGAVLRMVDGTRAAFFAAALGATPVTQTEFRIAAAPFGSQIEVGELAAMPAVDILHQRGWQVERVDPTSIELTRGSLPFGSRRKPYRKLGADFEPAYVDQVRQNGLGNGMDWRSIALALTGQARMMAVPRYTHLTGGVDPAELAHNAIYGIATMAPVVHLGGNYYQSSLIAQEIPA